MIGELVLFLGGEGFDRQEIWLARTRVSVGHEHGIVVVLPHDHR